MHMWLRRLCMRRKLALLSRACALSIILEAIRLLRKETWFLCNLNFLGQEWKSSALCSLCFFLCTRNSAAVQRNRHCSLIIALLLGRLVEWKLTNSDVMHTFFYLAFDYFYNLCRTSKSSLLTTSWPNWIILLPIAFYRHGVPDKALFLTFSNFLTDVGIVLLKVMVLSKNLWNISLFQVSNWKEDLLYNSVTHITRTLCVRNKYIAKKLSYFLFLLSIVFSDVCR